MNQQNDEIYASGVAKAWLFIGFVNKLWQEQNYLGKNLSENKLKGFFFLFDNVHGYVNRALGLLQSYGLSSI